MLITTTTNENGKRFIIFHLSNNITTIAETIEGLTFAVVPPPIAPAAPPVTEDVYGFASPLPLAAPDPFASAPANPFATPQPATGNPFAGVPVAAAPAAVSLPTINRGKSQRIPVPAVGKKTQLPKPAIIVGIAAAGVVLLLLLGVVVGRMTTSTSFSAAEKKEINQFLEKYGKDVEAKDEHGVPRMHRAVQHGTLAVVKYFVSKGVSVHVVDDDQYTPLHMAASWSEARDNREVEIAKFLIAQGADTNAKRTDGETPLYDALKGSRPNIEMVNGQVQGFVGQPVGRIRGTDDDKL